MVTYSEDNDEEDERFLCVYNLATGASTWPYGGILWYAVSIVSYVFGNIINNTQSV